MKKLNRQGFAGIELVLILVIVAIIAGVGWYVLKSKDDTNLVFNDTVQGSSNPSKSEDDEVNVKKQIKSGKLNCFDLFEITAPDSWYGFVLDNGYDQCGVANVEPSKLPAVGSLSGKDIDFIFSVPEKTNKTLSQLYDGIKDTPEADGSYPSKVLRKQIIELNSGQKALLVLSEGGHYNTKDYYFSFIMGGKLIQTGWRADSELSSQALDVVKTIE